MKYKSIYIFLYLVIFVACNKAKIALISLNSQVYECKIYASTEKSAWLLDSTNIWKSLSIGNNEFFVFEFSRPVFIKTIIVNQPQLPEFDKITLVRAYTDNGFCGEYVPQKIEINQKVSFVLLKIEATRDFKLTKAYTYKVNYSIAFEKLNKSIAIKQISFYDSTNTRLQIYTNSNFLTNQNRQQSFPFRKIINNEPQKCCFVLTNAGFMASFQNHDTDKFFLGNEANNLQFRVKTFIFTKNKFNTLKYNSFAVLSKTALSLSNVAQFYYDFEDSVFVELKTLDTSIITDIRYATTNNFTHKIIYPCAICLLRYTAAKDLVLASEDFAKMGYKIKIFDAYRPHSAQYILWQAVPNINFVAPPDKGSIHNRGGAVDITLVQNNGIELDMGTPYDFFGVQAFTTFVDLPENILNNRQILWEVMDNHGFRKIKTEWWHLSHYSCMQFPISDFPLPCN